MRQYSGARPHCLPRQGTSEARDIVVRSFGSIVEPPPRTSPGPGHSDPFTSQPDGLCVSVSDQHQVSGLTDSYPSHPPQVIAQQITR